MAKIDDSLRRKPEPVPEPIPLPNDDDPMALSIEEQRRFFLALRLKESQIPQRFLEKTLANFDTRAGNMPKDIDQVIDVLKIQAKRKQGEIDLWQKIYEYMRKLPGGDLMVVWQMASAYIETFSNPDLCDRPGVLLYGPTGSGKTHLLCGILRELMMRGHKALFYSVPNLFKEMRATFDASSDRDEDQLLDEIANIDILALDDLGAEKTSEWVLDRLYWIINERYCNSRTTLITTNHNWPDDLEKAVGKRITSRLAEMCRVIGPFPSEDWRMKSAGLKRRLT